MKLKANSLFPILALIVSTIGVASAVVFVKISEVDATSTLMLRMFFAGGLAYATVLLPHRDSETSVPRRPENKSWRLIMLLLLSGVVATIDLLSNHWAVSFTSIANTSILMNLSPFFVAALSFAFFREKITPTQLAALSLSVVGACFLVFDGNAQIDFSSRTFVGDLLALNSALFYAIYMLTVKSLRDHFSSVTIIIWNSLTCAFLLVPFALMTSSKVFPETYSGWLVIALLALISQLLGHGLMAYALKHVDVVLASASTLARPIVAIIMGGFLFGEVLTLIQWIGVITVLLGLLLYKHPITFKNKQEAAPN